MKKIVKLTESDLTRIVKRVIQEENQLQEGFSWKSLLPTIVIAASLNLSSCKSKDEVKQKLPDIETKVEESVEKLNTLLDQYNKSDQNNTFPDHVEFLKVMSIKGPIKECRKCPNTYYIISKIDETDQGEHSDKYFIYQYEESNNGHGKFTASSDFYDNMEEAKRQLEYLIKNKRFDNYNSYSEYMDELENRSGWLELLIRDYKGESYSKLYHKPSDYFRDIDRDSKKLQDMEEDAKIDLKLGNISDKEYEIIIKSVKELLPKLQEFKYSIR